MFAPERSESSGWLRIGARSGVWIFLYSLPGVVIAALSFSSVPTASLGVTLATVLIASNYIASRGYELREALVGSGVQAFNYAVLFLGFQTSGAVPSLNTAAVSIGIFATLAIAGAVGGWLAVIRDFSAIPG